MEAQRIYDAIEQLDGKVELLKGSEGEITIPRGEERALVWLHDQEDEGDLSIRIEEQGRLLLIELFLKEAFRSIEIRQKGSSQSHLLSLMLTSGFADTTLRLEEPGASSRLSQLFLGGERERCEARVTTQHLSSDCQSNSLVKGVVGGEAKGIFRGMVYVAPDAQRTDARQTSRNIELSPTAHILTEPQLEIYADDVKCSHGATVGQLDPEAILYMRQRGLSEKQAHRLQIEGFASEVVEACPYTELGDLLREALLEKLQSI
jgi:Fe-S cluster assembly protein SufD